MSNMTDNTASTRNTAQIQKYRITWWLRGDNAPTELDEATVEDLTQLLNGDFREGELCVTSEDGETEFRGWWQLEDEATEPETLSNVDAINDIVDVLREVDGQFLAKIYNQVCSDQIVYKGNSLFEKVPDEKYRRETLETIGYEFAPDTVEPNRWVWGTPSNASETSFDSQEDAVTNAWDDAAQQVRGIREMSQADWDTLSLSKQGELIENILGDSES